MAFWILFIITLVAVDVIITVKYIRKSRALEAETEMNQDLLRRYEPLIQKQAIEKQPVETIEPEPVNDPPELSEPDLSEDEALAEITEILQANGYEIAFTAKPKAEEETGQPEPETESGKSQPEKTDAETSQEPSATVSQKEKKPKKRRTKGSVKK